MTATTSSDYGEEIQIRSVIDRWVDAFRRKDVDAALSVHTPDVVSFDIVPPLRYRGASEYRTAWTAAFEAFDGPIVMDLFDLTITVRDDIAFSHSLNKFQATTTDGDKADYWFRWTACFQKLDRRWLIVHDHTSLPTDFATGESIRTLKP